MVDQHDWVSIPVFHNCQMPLKTVKYPEQWQRLSGSVVLFLTGELGWHIILLQHASWKGYVCKQLCCSVLIGVKSQNSQSQVKWDIYLQSDLLQYASSHHQSFHYLLNLLISQLIAYHVHGTEKISGKKS